jgi:hypothetical protein
MSNRETHFMQLREWIPVDKFDWARLAYNENPNAIHILEKTWIK